MQHAQIVLPANDYTKQYQNRRQIMGSCLDSVSALFNGLAAYTKKGCTRLRERAIVARP